MTIELFVERRIRKGDPGWIAPANVGDDGAVPVCRNDDWGYRCTREQGHADSIHAAHDCDDQVLATWQSLSNPPVAPSRADRCGYAEGR